MLILTDEQEEAVDFLVDNPHVILLADMGSGKTAITLHALLELPGLTLLVAPIRVIESVWPREPEKWGALKGSFRIGLLRGSPAQREEMLEVAFHGGYDLLLVNPELLREVLEFRFYKDLVYSYRGKLLPFANLVVDESTKFKDSSTQRFKILRQHLGRFSRRYALTGTPTPAGIINLWSQVFLVDRGQRLGTSFTQFRDFNYYPSPYSGYKRTLHEGAQDRVLEDIADISFRIEAIRKPGQEAIHNVVEVELPARARKIYDDMEKRALAHISKTERITAAMAVTKLVKARQIASGFVYGDEGKVHAIHKEKIDALQTILEETGSPVIVVYQFRHELEALQKLFPQGRVYSEKVQSDWDAGRVSPLFLHPQSGGHGLNLQYGGHVMAFFSETPSLEQTQQTMARIDRTGQVNRPVYHFLRAKNTVDDLVLAPLLASRGEDQAGVLSTIKQLISKRRIG